jgi:hypothetical protein
MYTYFVTEEPFNVKDERAVFQVLNVIEISKFLAWINRKQQI